METHRVLGFIFAVSMFVGLGLLYAVQIHAGPMKMGEAINIALFFSFIVGLPMSMFGLIIWAFIDGKRYERAAKTGGTVNASPANPPPHIPPAGWDPTPVKPLTIQEDTVNSTKGQLKDSKLVKEVLKTRSIMEQRIVKMVQNGASLEDIRSRYRLSDEEVQNIIDKAWEDLAAKIRPMLESGMTREEITETLLKEPTDFDVESTRIQNSKRGQKPVGFRKDEPPGSPIVSKPVEATSTNIPDPTPAKEGERKLKAYYAKVRSAKLREAAILIHGRDCCACGGNFDRKYGKNLARGYIEVHHLKTIAGGVRKTNPATDLVTLCSDCHTMADRLARQLENPPTTIDELKKLLFPPSSPQDSEVPHAAAELGFRKRIQTRKNGPNKKS